jgi:hypothetical protein
MSNEISSSSKRARMQLLYWRMIFHWFVHTCLGGAHRCYLNFTARSGTGAGAFGIKTDSAGPAIASNSDWCIKHLPVRLLDYGDDLFFIHIDEALVTNHSTGLKLFQNQICAIFGSARFKTPARRWPPTENRPVCAVVCAGMCCYNSGTLTDYRA